ncbi:ABC transporter permease [Youngiibacter fragilis]|uniref:Transport permease protein n=1 Tax=Youngiibacter fragilis 232.1 TaxID=994573 RepID=V7I670_9CLOT|nr:ABC transporter permease [Youngiibacter fragilis]ETA80684.1 sugar ABC transporter permease [Youngiibacter fragilis 232.1]
MLKKIKEITVYKELLYNLTSKELKLKYKNSALGFFWSFLNPLLMLTVYTFAFKFIMRIEIENYSLVLLAGLLPWNFFNASVQGSTMSLVNNSHLIKKVYFPREIIPLSLIMSNFVNFLMTMIVLFVAMMLFGVPLGINIFMLPVVLILLVMFTTGLSLMLSSLNVYYRDISHFVEILFMAWIYLTPVIYSFSMIPEKYRIFLMLNPMTLVVELIRDTTIRNVFPDLKFLLALLVVSSITLAVGQRVFTKLERDIAERI